MKFKSSFRVVTFLGGLLACLGIVVIVTVCYPSDREKTFDLMEAYAEGIANGISSFFTDAAAVASAAATLNSVRDLDWDVAAQDFTGFIRAIPYVHRISIVDSSGFLYDVYETGPSGNPWQGGRRTADNTDPNAAPVSVTEREYFRALVTENTGADFFIIVNEPFIPVGFTEKAFITSAPIIRGGQSIGTVNVAQMGLELSMLYERLTVDFLDKFGSEAHMYLISESGQLVSRLEYRESYGTYMDELFGSAETVSVFELGEDTVSAIDRAVRNWGRVISAKIDGTSCLVAGTEIEGTPFVVCLAAPKAYMLKTSRAVFTASLAFFALSYVLMLFGIRSLKKGGPLKDGGDEESKPSKKTKRPPRIARMRLEEGTSPPDLSHDSL